MTIAQRILTPFLFKAQPSSSGDGPNSQPRFPPRLLACSAVDRNLSRMFAMKEMDRKLCQDRKGALEHLMPKALTKSTFRIVVTQGSFVLSKYANDQLQQDIARDKLVAEGQMTQEEADEAADEWEAREWKLRWETFPSKLTEAMVKYHLIVLVMRLYEYIASQWVDKMSLDALTLDTFHCAERLDRNRKEGETRVDVGRQMFGICGRANLIAFLADYSVHQIILGYGYYQFIREKRRRRQWKGSREDDEEGEEESHPIVQQSAKLVFSRSLGLMFTSAGGAIGSMLYPGWGTLVGSNLGDSLGGIVSEGSASTSG